VTIPCGLFATVQTVLRRTPRQEYYGATQLKVGGLGPLGFQLAVAVQPGCTNLWLGSLLHSRINADDGRCIGRSQARAKAEYKPSMAKAFAHLTVGERKAKVNSLRTIGG